MLIACEHCHKQINLPDDKVPDRMFAIKCPHCKERLQIDPTQAAVPAAPAPMAPMAAAPPVAAQTPAPPSAPWAGQFEPLLPLHGTELQIFKGLYPVGGVVNLADDAADWMIPALAEIGVRDVETFESLEDVIEKLREVEMGVLLIRVEKASVPPFDPLKPLYHLPLNLRRRTFVALLADNLRSLDGQLAFFLQVNCLINAREVSKVPGVLQRAILFHLKHYRYWTDGQE